MFREYLDATAAGRLDPIFLLVERIDLAPGSIEISLAATELATMLEVSPERIAPNMPTIDAPFRLRKRGVETKIILQNATRRVDDALLTNVAHAHTWFGMIKAGQAYAEIAETAGISKRRVQQVLDLAFLAPDIVRDVTEGNQPLGFTSDWCLRHDLPSDWDEQCKRIATL